MAFSENFTFTQGTDCEKFTITDSSTGYQGTELSIVSQAVPASPLYNRILFRFTSPFFTGGTYDKEVVIANSQNAATVHAAIAAAFNGDATILALFTTTDNTTSVSVAAKKGFIYTELDVILEDDNYFTDVAITETQEALPKASERTLTILFPDGSNEVVAFPYVNGTNDSVDVAITKDYAMLAQVSWNSTPEIEITKPIITLCNTDSYIREVGVEFDNRNDNRECSEALRFKWSKLYDYRTQAITQASIERIQLAQSFLDLTREAYLENLSNCCN